MWPRQGLAERRESGGNKGAGETPTRGQNSSPGFPSAIGVWGFAALAGPFFLQPDFEAVFLPAMRHGGQDVAFYGGVHLEASRASRRLPAQLVKLE